MCVYCASRRYTAMMRSTSSETTAAMKADVLLMEKRLVALRERMASARHPQNPVSASPCASNPTLTHPPKLLSRRSRSEAARSCNPTGATWASARTDRPLNSKAYASAVLAAGPSGHEREDSSSGAPPARAWDLQTAADGGAGGRPQTLVVEGALGSSTLTLEGEDGRDGVNQNRTPSEALYSWNPGSAIVSDCVDDTRDELLAPPDPGRGGSSSRASAAARTLANRAEAGGGGGALLEGSYDEAAAAASFQAAVAEWRSGGAAAAVPPSAASPTLAASIELLTRELHLPAELPLAQAVSAANAAVGLSAGGATLTQQVSALLEATGLRPTAHASMTPRSCLSTQTRPDYYKLLLEQKRRDGIL